jgi:signal transduction histidine kinase
MFHQARLKLTAWYLLIIMVISLLFSGLIYQLINTEMTRFANSQRNRFERRLDLPSNPRPLIFIDDDLLAESRHRLFLNLLFINGAILLISGSLSYFLAGQTLLPIQKATEDQKRFISDASHELRTPLTGLKALFEVSLRDPNLNLTESKKVLKEGIIQTDQLKNLSDSLLELTHLQNNGSSLSFQPISISIIMANSIKKIKPSADKKKIIIKSKSIKTKISVDSQKIEELFLILLDNAIKYSSPKSTIRFLATQKNKHIIVKVIDQGIGISSSNLPYIFNRFYRADNARTKNGASGYGLGLSIAQKIAQQHHAFIKVKSTPNQGSTFSVNFQI